MKYHCKYPHKLNMEGYCKKVVEKHKHIDQYLDLLAEEMENLTWFMLIEINSIIEHPKNNLDQTTSYLLKIDKLSKEEYMAIPEHTVEPESAFNAIFLARHDPREILALIANNMRLELKKDKQDQYEEFLKEITIKCAKEIAVVNQLKSSKPKKVIFDDAKVKGEAVSFREQNINYPALISGYQKSQMLHGLEHLKRERKREREALAKSGERIKENVRPLPKKGRYPL